MEQNRPYNFHISDMTGPIKRFWVGITDIEIDGVWLNPQGENVTPKINWNTNQPTGNAVENRATVRKNTKGKYVFHDTGDNMNLVYACTLPQM